MLKRILKWTALVLAVLAVAGFVAFLYLIPPLTMIPVQDLVASQTQWLPSLSSIADPATRTLAERGRQIVLASDCTGCHQPPGPENAVPSMYLSGGMRFVTHTHGTVVSRNLTPDPDTGLGRRDTDSILRAMRGGVRPDGWIMSHSSMPWSLTANWSEEDRMAVVTYLRHIPPVRHAIPDRQSATPADAGIAEAAYGVKDAGRK
jgi:mono/diheme cytochrome c family protein